MGQNSYVLLNNFRYSKTRGIHNGMRSGSENCQWARFSISWPQSNIHVSKLLCCPMPWEWVCLKRGSVLLSLELSVALGVWEGPCQKQQDEKQPRVEGLRRGGGRSGTVVGRIYEIFLSEWEKYPSVFCMQAETVVLLCRQTHGTVQTPGTHGDIAELSCVCVCVCVRLCECVLLRVCVLACVHTCVCVLV